MTTIQLHLPVYKRDRLLHAALIGCWLPCCHLTIKFAFGDSAHPHSVGPHLVHSFMSTCDARPSFRDEEVPLCVSNSVVLHLSIVVRDCGMI